MDEDRHREIMYHVGRPGEDGFTERMLAAWGVDGHNSHTNICSSGARVGYHLWMGMDRPSPDHENARVILLVSSHLEAGHYFNPHAQRVMEGKRRGARLIVFDTRLSNTATHADHWISTYPGLRSRGAAGCGQPPDPHRPLQTAASWSAGGTGANTWSGTTRASRPTSRTSSGCSAPFTPITPSTTPPTESGVPAETIAAVAEVVAGAGTQLSTHNWRSAAAGNLGGWQVARALFLLNALLGAIAVPGWHLSQLVEQVRPPGPSACRTGTPGNGTT